MKKFAFCCLLCAGMLSSNNIFSQCTADPNCSEAQLICPATLDSACADEAYAQTITISLGDSVAGFPLDSIIITGFTGLPSGIGFSCTPSSCSFPQSANSCILLSGTPALAGTYPIRVQLTAHVKFFGNPIAVPVDTPAGNIVVLEKDCNGDCGGTASVDACGICSGGNTGILPNCDDGDLCTTDDCDGLGGCVNTQINCDDSDDCTIDGCSAGQCTNDTIPCDDGNLCTTDGCVGGQCVFSAIICEPISACFSAECVDGVCVETPLYSTTSHAVDVSGMAFTPADLIISVGDTVVWTNTDGFHNINGSTATFPSNPELFFSGQPAQNPWTFSFVFNTPGAYDYRCDVHFSMGMLGTITVTAPALDCAGVCGGTAAIDNCGICSGGTTGILPDCADADLCTTDACDGGGGCINDPVNCDDADSCTIDFCDLGDCLHSPDPQCAVDPCDTLDCDDNDVCTIDTCVAGACSNTLNQPVLAFDYQSNCAGDTTFITNLSTGVDAGAVYHLDIGSDGSVDFSLPASALPIDSAVVIPLSGDIDFTVIVVNSTGCSDTLNANIVLLDCNDNNACTLDSCANLQCFYTAVVCDDNSVCTTDDCDTATGCVFTPIVCDDLNACTTNECDSTSGCFFIFIDCNDNDACTTDGCDSVATGCSNTPMVCTDGNACTIDSCYSVVGCIFPVIDCNDNNACTTDGCDSVATGCFNLALDCEDLDSCTIDFCDLGSCFHDPDPLCSVDPCDTLDCDDNDVCTIDTCVAGACSNTLNQPVLAFDYQSNCAGDTTFITNLSTGVDAGAVYHLDIGSDGSVDFSLPASALPIDSAVVIPLSGDIDFTVIVVNSTGCSDTLNANIVLLDCNDNNACTLDSCANLQCFYTAVVCDDNSVCTTDDCDTATGCVFIPIVCDDLNACTTNECDSTSGCFFTMIDCNDNNACTVDDCDTASGCTYVTLDCNDNNSCTVDSCDSASGCVYSPLDCNDNDACSIDNCDPASGCIYSSVDCDDSDACTLDSCDSALGCFYTTVDCNDSDECTTDDCEPANGCFYTAVVCDDQNFCTTDSCDAASGCFFTPIDCDDQDACTVEACDPASGCIYIPVDCNDNDACTLDSCDAASGCFYTTIDCNDNDACTDDACDPASGCVYTAVVCDDQDACTTDACDPALGCFYSPVSCDDQDACTNDTCAPASGCVYTAVICDDQDACTIDSCDNGICNYIPVSCDDGIDCTNDFCLGQCFNVPIDCNDNNPCTNDTCDAGICLNTTVDCSDSDDCTDDVCVNGTCFNNPINCDDGNPCTADSCDAGNCTNTAVAGCCLSDADCDDGNICNNDICNGGTCVYVPICCDDNDPCTFDFCENGACVFVALFCDDGDPCTDNACVNGVCEFTTINCDDSDLCTTDSCASGICLHTPLDCSDTDLCTIDGCDQGLCFNNPLNCDDLDPCTNDSCVQGVCANTPINCDDADLCTVDKCVSGTCTHLPQDCDDFDPCTNDYCVNGVCFHDVIPTCCGGQAQCDDGDPCTTDDCVNNVCENTSTFVDLQVAEAELPPFCQGSGLVLTAVSNSAVSYSWSTGETTSSVQVATSGTYSVTALDAGGCSATVSHTVSVDITGMLSAYTILAKKEVHMHENTVFQGGVGITVLRGKARIHDNTQITASGTFMKADDIQLSGGSVITTQIPDPASVALPPFEYNTQCSSGQSLQIPDNSNITLTSNLYKGITIGKGSTVTFTADNIDLENIYTKDDVTIQFSAPCVKLKICKKLRLGKNNSFNPDGAAEVIAYVEQDVTIEGGSDVTADIYMNGGKMTIHDASQSDPNVMTGLFIVNILDAGKFTEWYQDSDCTCDQSSGQLCQGNELKVFSFTLVSADTDLDLGPLNDGDVIDLTQTGPISVRANVCVDGLVESVRFLLNGNNYKMENIPFYTIAGDNSGNYLPWNIGPGTYTITAIPYSANNGTGTVGTSHTITITIIASSARMSNPNPQQQLGAMNEDGVMLRAHSNPFSDRLNIEFSLPNDSRATLELYNLSGHRLAMLYNGNAEGSRVYKREFNAAQVPGGVLIYRLTTSTGVYFNKAILVND